MGIVEKYGCECTHSQPDAQMKTQLMKGEVKQFCKSKGYSGTGENLAQTYGDPKYPEETEKWRKEIVSLNGWKQSRGHDYTMVNSKMFGCYLATGCNCQFYWLARCIYCK